MRQRCFGEGAAILPCDAASSDVDREKLDRRAAGLSGVVAVTKVGAATGTELKECKIRVEGVRIGHGASREVGT